MLPVSSLFANSCANRYGIASDHSLWHIFDQIAPILCSRFCLGPPVVCCGCVVNVCGGVFVVVFVVVFLVVCLLLCVCGCGCRYVFVIVSL